MLADTIPELRPPASPCVSPEAPEPVASRAAVNVPEAGAANAMPGTSLPDARLAALEPLLAANDWKAVAGVLGATGHGGALPAALELIYAIARKESPAVSSDPHEGNDAAILAMATLLGSAPDSAAALLLTKRLLRRNPVSLGKRPAPRASVSIAIVLLAVIVGGAVGYAVQFGPWASSTSGTRGVAGSSQR